MIPSDDVKRAVHTLHRYFIWANRLWIHLDDQLASNRQQGKRDEIQTFLYMSYWYAALYVVVEGWKKLHLHDKAIDGLLSSPNVGLLRRYRNGVFHFHAEYYDQRFIQFISEGENTVEWVRTLSRQFGRFFLDWFKRTKEASNAKGS